AVLRLPGAVVETPLDEHRRAGRQLVDHLLGLGAEERDPVVPGQLARAAVVADHVVVAGEVELWYGQPVMRVARLGCLYQRAVQVDCVRSSSHRALRGCVSGRRQAPASASRAWSAGRSSCMGAFFVFPSGRALTTS